MTIRATAPLAILALFAGLIAPAHAADPAAVCLSAKQKAFAKWLDKTLGCVSRAAGSGGDSATACLTAYDVGLAVSFDRSEDRGGCAVVGDVASVEGVLDACAGAVRSALSLDAPTLPATRCGSQKLRAAGRRLKREVSCHAKAARRQLSVAPSCLDAAAAGFDKAFGAAEGRGDCVQTGDASAAAAAGAACLSSLLDALPSCTDMRRNGPETDIDCGGPTCGGCADGGTCAVDGDCQSGDCTSGVCIAPDSTAVCTRWLADRASLTEGTWSGDVDTCTAGDVSAAGRASALTNMNLYRWLANLPPVTDAAANDDRAQQCALLMHANHALRHDPPPSWTCWTQAGADGAATSNISPTPGVAGVDLYMFDPGNPTTIGHRRWILSNWIDLVGLGSTSSYSCLLVVGDGTGVANAPWVAWPPAGIVPHAALIAGGGSVDVTGWTVQSDTIDLGSATVTVREDGVVRPVDVTPLLAGYGSGNALRFNPNGWQSGPGHTYEVTLANVATPIDYTIHVVSCP